MAVRGVSNRELVLCLALAAALSGVASFKLLCPDESTQLPVPRERRYPQAPTCVPTYSIVHNIATAYFFPLCGI